MKAGLNQAQGLVQTFLAHFAIEDRNDLLGGKNKAFAQVKARHHVQIAAEGKMAVEVDAAAVGGAFLFRDARDEGHHSIVCVARPLWAGGGAEPFLAFADLLKSEGAVEAEGGGVVSRDVEEDALEEGAGTDFQGPAHEGDADALPAKTLGHVEGLDAPDVADNQHANSAGGRAIFEGQQRVVVRIVQMEHGRLSELWLVHRKGALVGEAAPMAIAGAGGDDLQPPHFAVKARRTLPQQHDVGQLRTIACRVQVIGDGLGLCSRGGGVHHPFPAGNAMAGEKSVHFAHHLCCGGLRRQRDVADVIGVVDAGKLRIDDGRAGIKGMFFAEMTGPQMLGFFKEAQEVARGRLGSILNDCQTHGGILAESRKNVHVLSGTVQELERSAKIDSRCAFDFPNSFILRPPTICPPFPKGTNAAGFMGIRFVLM